MADAEFVEFTDNVRNFLGAARYAVIATLDPDGAPHQAIVWYLLRGDTLVLNSRVGRRWPANLRRDPRMSFAVEEGENAVSMSAVAEPSAEGDDALADISEMAWRYDEPEDAQREIERFRTEQRISFLVRPTKVHVHGDPR